MNAGGWVAEFDGEFDMKLTSLFKINHNPRPVMKIISTSTVCMPTETNFACVKISCLFSSFYFLALFFFGAKSNYSFIVSLL